MKTKTLILTILLPFAFYLTPLLSPAQWTQQNSGTDQDLKSICFTDNDNGWAVGNGGIILHTSDGGDNWFQQSSGTENDLTSVRFMNADSGWVTGGMSIYNTVDGGDNWEENYVDIVFYLNDVFFTDPLHGWAVGERSYFNANWGTIIHSDDGGITWNRQDPHCNGFLKSIHFMDTDTGWVVGGFYWLHWNPICFILKTTNRGITWEVQINTFCIYSPLKSVCFTNTENGWAVGENNPNSSVGPTPNILRTSNGGTQWDSTLYNGTYSQEFSLESVCFIDEKTGWTVGGKKYEYSIILQTIDGGDSWTEQAAGTKQMLNSVCFVDAEEGWIVADSGIILHTDNGGTTSVEENHPPGHQNKIKLCSFPNPTQEISEIRYEISRLRSASDGQAEIRNVVLSVFDIHGKEITRLVNETQTAGEYTVRFDASNLPAGLYLVRLQAGKESAVGKVLVVH